MRWTGLPLVCWFLMLLPAQAGHTPPQIFLRVHIQTAGQGLPDTQATSIQLPPDGETIQIRALPEVSEHDLIDVKSDSTGAVHLLFNHQGQIALSAATGQNLGRIMVVVINGVIVYAPVIDEQITNGQLVLPHPLNAEAVQLLKATAQQNVLKAAKT